MIARILPDVPAVERAFDYLVPERFRDQVRVGTIVRIDLHGRRVRGWVVELPDAPPPGVELKPIARVTGAGPPPEVVELARWAAWRWAGRWQHLLRAASPPGAVSRSGGSSSRSVPAAAPRTRVVRLPPAADRLPLVQEAVAGGPAIVVVPAVDLAVRLANRLRRDGHRVALLAGDVDTSQWALAASGDASVVGTRVAAWAPVPDDALRSVLLLDEHDEAHRSEQAPTWHARDALVERARRAGVPCALVSPVPTLEALAVADDVDRPNPAVERAGWPVVEIADRRQETTTRGSLLGERLATLLRGDGRAVCVLNRLGRSRLLLCATCETVAACDRCGAAVTQPERGVLHCPACAAERPVVCASCGGTRMKNLRAGISRIREELAALTGEDVVEVTGDAGDPTDARVVIGTEAVLHRLRPGGASLVAFLDIDQELLAPRYRAPEQALALVARAARIAGGRDGGGRLLLQTRTPDHEVLRAVVRADPGLVADAEAERRRALRYPPFAALAVVSGPAAPDWAASAPDVLGVEVLGPADGRWLVRAADSAALADFLALVDRPPGRLRIEVDPLRV